MIKASRHLFVVASLFAAPALVPAAEPVTTQSRTYGPGIDFGRVVVCDAAKVIQGIQATLTSWVGLVGRWNELQAEVVRSSDRFNQKLAAIKAERPATADQYKAQCDRLTAIKNAADKLLRVDTAWVPQSRQLRLVAEGFSKVQWKDAAINRRIEGDVRLYRTESAAIEGPWAKSDGQSNYDVSRWNNLAKVWQKNQLELDPNTGYYKGKTPPK